MHQRAIQRYRVPTTSATLAFLNHQGN